MAKFAQNNPLNGKNSCLFSYGIKKIDFFLKYLCFAMLSLTFIFIKNYYTLSKY